MKFPTLLTRCLETLSGSGMRRRRWTRLAERIITMSDGLTSLSDTELKKRALDLRWQAYSRTRPSKLLPVAYALVREASRREHGQAHFVVQLVAGTALIEGGVVEMRTGEGKTLTALLPTFLHALPGLGGHVITSNDYLAERDADFARPVFTRLGMTVGCVSSALPQEERKKEYDCDVTYGTAREFGFDFLRDRLKRDRGDDDEVVQRGQYFALVDEADNVLIDDARTPLLIATAEENSDASINLFQWCAETARELAVELDYRLDVGARRAWLTNHGCRSVLRRNKPPGMDAIDMPRIYRQIENALVAEHLFRRDRDYIVNDDGVSIVDESTGRVADGRQWQDGLHQAVEALEQITISDSTRTSARMTVQSYFRRYVHLVGLTGTARTSRREFKHIFGLQVISIPTRRPCQIKGLSPRLFTSIEEKYEAIAHDVRDRLAAGQAVLVGTPSVAASESLSQALISQCIEHHVLNCRHHEQEADIVQQAGQAGRVTIATNMAGRGTDIHVDEAVQRAGGLHIIATEMHSSTRIDRQLIGRTARQGSPGTYQFFLSLEDELLKGVKGEMAGISIPKKSQHRGELPAAWRKKFQDVQAFLERRHERDRRLLLKREQQRDRVCRDIGLDPLLETADTL